MKSKLLTLVTVIIAAATLAAGPVAANASTVTANATADAHSKGNITKVCGAPKPHQARCFAELRTDVHGGKGIRGAAAADRTGSASALPKGLSPSDLRSAYHLPAAGGANQTVAIVDAGDDATAEADLAVYRSTYGLPACTTANGCFHKVNQRGAASPLPADQGWGVEIALDLDMVSAACPQCKILLVEADSATMQNLAASVDTSVALGATEVSNSYGGTEDGSIFTTEGSYSHPGVAIVAASGDGGYGPASAPAVFPSVVAVGGTSLTKATNARGWTESAWNLAGSSCSAWIDKPAWQHDANCPGRMVADVAADADPQTGPAVYGTTDQLSGWGVVGGTSASSPYIAGVIALAGHPQKFPNASAFYTDHSGLFDVTSGSNTGGVMDCGGDYQCTAGAGYDGPTGWGTPNGVSGF
ncbi:MAG: S8 family serine peptidase [Catenulispora sp.]|nr:S8 family serine peptidase [Catenulispora sp.]